jgi:hypothetical protein
MVSHKMISASLELEASMWSKMKIQNKHKLSRCDVANYTKNTRKSTKCKLFKTKAVV